LSSLDYHVGASDELGRDFEAKSFCGF